MQSLTYLPKDISDIYIIPNFNSTCKAINYIQVQGQIILRTKIQICTTTNSKIHAFTLSMETTTLSKFIPLRDLVFIIRGWVIVNPKCNELNATNCMQCIQIDEHRAILFGHNSTEKDTYIMRIEPTNEVQISKHSKLEEAVKFCWTSAPIRISDEIYAVDSEKIIHIYAIKTGKWSIMH